jgi:hypothetical protein
MGVAFFRVSFFSLWRLALATSFFEFDLVAVRLAVFTAPEDLRVLPRC